jgi:hypothetical protein
MGDYDKLAGLDDTSCCGQSDLVAIADERA